VQIVQDRAGAELMLRWSRAAVAALEDARAQLDALNVYPVPDTDTGTNLYLTLEGAVSAVDRLDASSTVQDALCALARGAVESARGNSGAILAQMVTAGTEQLIETSDVDAPGQALADLLDGAATQARAAVSTPVEGTMLTVVRAAADASIEVARRDPAGLQPVLTAAVAAADDAVQRTPDQLAQLREAGVVDAGGRGVVVLLEALDTTLTGRRRPPHVRRLGRPDQQPGRQPRGSQERASVAAQQQEVIYVLSTSDTRLTELRAVLEQIGDSVVVTGAPEHCAVHLHTTDPAAAIAAGRRIGHPQRIRVDVLHPAGRRQVLALTAGAGLAEIVSSAGPSVTTLEGTSAPSTAAVLAAIRDTGADEVVVLPNGPGRNAIAEAAATITRAEGIRTGVVPSVAQVQGLAAVAVHDPSRAFDDDLVTMTAAAARTRHGAVTVATRHAVTMAGVCHPGDVLGVVEGDFAAIGTQEQAVAAEIVQRLLAAGGELLTLAGGLGAHRAVADALAESVRTEHPEVDTVIYEAGPERYPLLVGVE